EQHFGAACVAEVVRAEEEDHRGQAAQKGDERACDDGDTEREVGAEVLLAHGDDEAAIDGRRQQGDTERKWTIQSSHLSTSSAASRHLLPADAGRRALAMLAARAPCPAKRGKGGRRPGEGTLFFDDSTEKKSAQGP